MDQHLIYLLLGLGAGAVYAALALALVVTYRSSGVVNFATGAIALMTAYTYAYFREGQFLILLPFFDKTVDLGTKLDFWPALICSCIFSALLGLLLYGLVFRPLRTAPPVARAVASIGVMVTLTGLMAQRVGTAPVNPAPILPNDPWAIGKVNVPSDRIWFAVTIVAITFALAAAFKFTRFGLVTRAAAETEKGAYVCGIAPDRLAAVNWMLSAVVAGISGILIAPIVPLVPLSYTLFIVPALAAALMGRFQYLVPAVFGGLAIGMLQSELTNIKGDYDWLPSSGMPELIPLVLILAVLVIGARPLPSRGALIQQTLGRAPRPRGLLFPTLAATLFAALGLVLLEHSWRAALLTSLIFSIISLSLVVVTGYCGQISLAQLTLAGCAGFLLGPMTTDWHFPFTDQTIPFPIAPLLAALGAMVIGVVIGLPALRIRGLPVAVTTLALGVALEALWFHNTDFVGASGKNVVGPELFGADLSAGVGRVFPRLEFCFLVLGVLVVVAVGVAKLRTSKLGSEMLAVRANERSAAGAGIDVVRVKLLAFAIGAFIAGLGGSLLGYKQGNVTFDSFTTLVGLALFATVYLAGITSVSGGILAGILGSGGLVFLATNEWLELGDWYGTILGAGLVLTVILNPEGIVGPVHVLLDRGRTAGRAGLPAPPVLPPAPSERTEARPLVASRPLLVAEGLGVSYGGMIAVDGVDLSVPAGAIAGLIGPNGAGKTTLLDALSGFTTARGAVSLAGQRLDRLAPHARVRRGLGRTFQHTELYEDLSVSENVVVGLAAGGGREVRGVDKTLELLDLTALAEQPVGELSQGRRQLVSIARALVADPKILLLDEPAGGLDSTESQWLGERLRRIRDSGVTILLIDHDMHLVLNLCDEIHVLDFGRIIASGSPSVVKTDRKVAAAYLGSTHAEKPVTT